MVIFDLQSTFVNSVKGKIICIWAGKAAILTIGFDDSVDLKHIINQSLYYIDRIREILGTYVHWISIEIINGDLLFQH